MILVPCWSHYRCSLWSLPTRHSECVRWMLAKKPLVVGGCRRAPRSPGPTNGPRPVCPGTVALSRWDLGRVASSYRWDSGPAWQHRYHHTHAAAPCQHQAWPGSHPCIRISTFAESIVLLKAVLLLSFEASRHITVIMSRCYHNPGLGPHISYWWWFPWCMCPVAIGYTHPGMRERALSTVHTTVHSTETQL